MNEHSEWFTALHWLELDLQSISLVTDMMDLKESQIKDVTLDIDGIKWLINVHLQAALY